MRNILVYPVGCTPASHIAAGILTKKGIEVTDHITPDATHLLMDVPSLSGKGLLKSCADLQELLSLLSPRITLIGGMLPDAVERDKSLPSVYPGAVKNPPSKGSLAALDGGFCLRLLFFVYRLGKALVGSSRKRHDFFTLLLPASVSSVPHHPLLR